MNLVYAFSVGAIIGAGVMVYVYRNNTARLQALADDAEARYRKLLSDVKARAGR